MRTTDYSPGTLILSAGETFRYLGEFHLDFINKKAHLYIPIKTKNKYNTLKFPEWCAKNNIPITSAPFNTKFEAEIIPEEDEACK